MMPIVLATGARGEYDDGVGKSMDSDRVVLPISVAGGDWHKMPLGTRAHSSIGGYWEREVGGWRASSGSIFPMPGADVSHVSCPVSV